MSTLFERLEKCAADILANPRKCDICGEKETPENVMLLYKNGKVMCDDCFLAYYSCENCVFYNSLGCPYSGCGDPSMMDLCDKFRAHEEETK